MKHARKSLLIIAMTLLIATVLLGCNSIPEEYTDGVKLDRSYPDDDMPIMDDAIVYFCDEDDDEITIKYGVEDDLDDIADFYKDHFEDNDIVLDDETDNNTRYSAEGAYKDFIFSLRASNASGEYEKQVFETVVKIEIEFVDETVAAIDQQVSIDEQLIGFWRQESFDDGSGALSTTEYGVAYEFTNDGSLCLYYDFEHVGTGGWSVIDQDTVLLTAIDGSQSEVSAVIDERSGKDYLIWEDSTGTLVFYRQSSAEFLASAPVELSPDEQLAAAVSDTTWYYVHYSNPVGEIFSDSSGSLIYYSDGTLEDAFNGETKHGNWSLSDGMLYCDYTDSTSASWNIEIKTEGGINYLYYYGSEAPEFWLYADQLQQESAATPTESTTYTTDADVARLIVDVTWYSAYYLLPDGSQDPDDVTTISLVYHQDGTFVFDAADDIQSGTWYIQDQSLYIKYDNTSDIFEQPSYIEYHADSDSMWLFLGNIEEDGAYWVFTTYEP